MTEADVEVDVSDLAVWGDSHDSAEVLALSCQPDDGRRLVDRLCAALNYWPAHPGINPHTPPGGAAGVMGCHAAWSAHSGH